MTNNITIIGINFYPEDSAIGLYTTQMAEYLSENGFNVSVVTGFPYYPEWKIKKEYKSKSRFLKEELGGIKIYRYKQFVPSNPTFAKRILHLVDFTIGSIWNLRKIAKSDLVISIVPFTSSVLIGKILTLKNKNSKLWVHVQDFEFDAAIESGLSSTTGLKGLIFKVLFGIERRLFNTADVASTISVGMIEKLSHKTKTKTYFFPNWVNPNEIKPSNNTQHKYLNSSKFKILYSGNIGAKQDWEFFLKILKNYTNDDSIEFIIVGAGAKRKWLKNKIEKYNNCKLFDPVEYENLSILLTSADLHFLFQKNDIIDTVMPSKLLGMMSSAVPSIVTGNLESEVAKVFHESKGGVFFDGEDVEGVLKGIDTFKNDKELSTKSGVNARNYIIQKYSHKNVLGDFKNKISEVLN